MQNSVEVKEVKMDRSGEIEIALQHIDYYVERVKTTTSRIRWLLEEQKLRDRARSQLVAETGDVKLPPTNTLSKRRKRRLNCVVDEEDKKKREGISVRNNVQAQIRP